MNQLTRNELPTTADRQLLFSVAGCRFSVDMNQLTRNELPTTADRRLLFMDYDVIIIGGGPTGLAAAVYTGRALLKTLVIEKQFFGGQIVNSFAIDNYPGFADGVTGHEFTQLFVKHAKRFGA